MPWTRPVGGRRRRPAGRHGLRRGPELRDPRAGGAERVPASAVGRPRRRPSSARWGRCWEPPSWARCSDGLARAWPSASRRSAGVGALGTDANSLTPAIVHALPRTCAMRWPPTATRSRPCSARVAGVAGLVLMLFLRETRLATTVDGSGHGPTKARTTAAAGARRR
ncbi:MAG: hypothetical protein ACLSVD_00320 [Eggerthellaceae bacterium]